MSLPGQRNHVSNEQGVDALGVAFQQVTQGLVRVEEVLRLQERQVAQRIHEASRRHEQTSAAALQETMQRVEQKMKEKDEAVRVLAQRMEARARKVEEWITVVEERLIPSVGLEGFQNCGRSEVKLGELEMRMRNLEESVQRALLSVFPRVEELVAHLEKSIPGVTVVPTPEPSSSSTPIISHATSRSSNVTSPTADSTSLGCISSPSFGYTSPDFISTSNAPISSSTSIPSPNPTNSSFTIRPGSTSVAEAAFETNATSATNTTSVINTTTNPTSGTNATSSSFSHPDSPNTSAPTAIATARPMPRAQRESTGARQNPITEKEEADKKRIELRMEEAKRLRDNAQAFPSSMGETLCNAVHIGKFNDIKRLLDSGADVNYMDTRGDTPLMFALRGSAPQEAVVDLLLQRGAEVNAVDVCGQTAMHCAAAYDLRWQVVSLLIGAGGDVNARSAMGATPLHWAAHRDNDAAVRILLAAGADKRLKCWSGEWRGKTPFDVATYKNVRDLLRR